MRAGLPSPRWRLPALLAVPLARLADRRGRRISLSTAALIAAVGVALCVLGMVLGVTGGLVALH